MIFSHSRTWLMSCAGALAITTMLAAVPAAAQGPSVVKLATLVPAPKARGHDSPIHSAPIAGDADDPMRPACSPLALTYSQSAGRAKSLSVSCGAESASASKGVSPSLTEAT